MEEITQDQQLQIFMLIAEYGELNLIKHITEIAIDKQEWLSERD